jgi:hypothetical protein
LSLSLSLCLSVSLSPSLALSFWKALYIRQARPGRLLDWLLWPIAAAATADQLGGQRILWLFDLPSTRRKIAFLAAAPPSRIGLIGAKVLMQPPPGRLEGSPPKRQFKGRTNRACRSDRKPTTTDILLAAEKEPNHLEPKSSAVITKCQTKARVGRWFGCDVSAR